MKTLLMAILLSLSSFVYAEEIRIPLGEQGDINITKPQKGQSKAAVEAQFGEPKDWTDAKGQPPISSWQYENFVVYFESDVVIHSVLVHKRHKD